MLLFTDVNYDGFELRKEFNSYNGKKVYENEYALSLGMNSSSDILKVKYNGNPFEYINEIYSGILGRNIQLFKLYDSLIIFVSKKIKRTIIFIQFDEKQQIKYFGKLMP